MEIQMIYVQGHIEVLDASGEFLFSADTVQEAEEELELLAG